MRHLLLGALAGLFLASSAMATEVDLTKVLVDLDGKPLTSTPDPKSEPMTLKPVILSALSTLSPKQGQTDEQILAEKRETYDLMVEIHSATKITLDSSAVALIERGAARLPALYVGQIIAAIEPAKH